MKFDTLLSLKDAKSPIIEAPVIETPAIEYTVYKIVEGDVTHEVGIPSAMVAEFDIYIAEHGFTGTALELERFNAIGL